jgi:hypothetical protein
MRRKIPKHSSNPFPIENKGFRLVKVPISNIKVEWRDVEDCGKAKEDIIAKGESRARVKTLEYIETMKATEQYVKLYDITFMMYLSKSAIGVLCYIFKRVTTKHTFVVDYEDMIAFTHLSKRSIERGLQELRETGVVAQRGGNVYHINPNLFCKGKRV